MINKKGPVVMDWSPDEKSMAVVSTLADILEQVVLHVKQNIENHCLDGSEDVTKIAVAIFAVHTRALMLEIMNRGLDDISTDIVNVAEKMRLGIRMTMVQPSDELRSERWVEECISQLAIT